MVQTGARMRVAVVGTGFIGKLVAPKLAAWGYDVTYVVSTPRSLAKAEALAAEVGALASCDYDAVLASDKVDAVYLGIPNDLHYDYATRALLAGRHVILEKPMCSNYDEARRLVTLADERGLLLFDATTTLYQPSTLKAAEWLPRVGEVKLAAVNYSQYSSRYDRFRRGDIAPAFDPAHSGGALMDLGHYCLSWLCRLFGEPKDVIYLANVERGIDTSGMTLLDYGGFKATAIAAKDCGAPSYGIVQGTAGYIRMDGKPNALCPVELHLNDGTIEKYLPPERDQYRAEFEALRRFAESGQDGLALCHKMNELALVVSKVQTQARESAGVVFPADAH